MTTSPLSADSTQRSAVRAVGPAASGALARRGAAGRLAIGLLTTGLLTTASLTGCHKGQGSDATGRGASQARSARKRAPSPYRNPALASAPMVRFTRAYGFGRHKTRLLATPYEIDARPVSAAEYAAWVATHPDPALQAGPCRQNHAFETDASCLRLISPCRGPACPATCVDWCDAVAYCQAVGKRLCGALSGGATSWRRFNHAGASQWHNACVAQSRDAGPRIHLGHVGQWEDACEHAGASARCRTRHSTRGLPGRHDAAAARIVTCDPANAYPRLSHWRHVGFRCCRP